MIDWPLRTLFHEHVTAARIVEAIRALPAVSTPSEEGGSPPLDPTALQESDIVVSFALMHFGMKEKNPLDSVRFYSKHDPTRRLFLHITIFHLLIAMSWL